MKYLAVSSAEVHFELTGGWEWDEWDGIVKIKAKNKLVQLSTSEGFKNLIRKSDLIALAKELNGKGYTFTNFDVPGKVLNAAIKLDEATLSSNFLSQGESIALEGTTGSFTINIDRNNPAKKTSDPKIIDLEIIKKGTWYFKTCPQSIVGIAKKSQPATNSNDVSASKDSSQSNDPTQNKDNNHGKNWLSINACSANGDPLSNAKVLIYDASGKKLREQEKLCLNEDGYLYLDNFSKDHGELSCTVEQTSPFKLRKEAYLIPNLFHGLEFPELTLVDESKELIWGRNDYPSFINEDKREEQGSVNSSGDWILAVLLGDFNENPTVGQIVLRALATMIPLVDQVADLQDLSAALYFLVWKEEYDKTERWIQFVLVLIGCTPTLGSAAKSTLLLASKLPAGERLVQILKRLEKLGLGNADEWLMKLKELLTKSTEKIIALGLSIFKGIRKLIEKIFGNSSQKSIDTLKLLEETGEHKFKEAIETLQRPIKELIQEPKPKIKVKLNKKNIVEIGIDTIQKKNYKRLNAKLQKKFSRTMEEIINNVKPPNFHPLAFLIGDSFDNIAKHPNHPLRKVIGEKNVLRMIEDPNYFPKLRNLLEKRKGKFFDRQGRGGKIAEIELPSVQSGHRMSKKATGPGGVKQGTQIEFYLEDAIQNMRMGSKEKHKIHKRSGFLIDGVWIEKKTYFKFRDTKKWFENDKSGLKRARGWMSESEKLRFQLPDNPRSSYEEYVRKVSEGIDR